MDKLVPNKKGASKLSDSKVSRPAGAPGFDQQQPPQGQKEVETTGSDSRIPASTSSQVGKKSRLENTKKETVSTNEIASSNESNATEEKSAKSSGLDGKSLVLGPQVSKTAILKDSGSKKAVGSKTIALSKSRSVIMGTPAARQKSRLNPNNPRRRRNPKKASAKQEEDDDDDIDDVDFADFDDDSPEEEGLLGESDGELYHFTQAFADLERLSEDELAKVSVISSETGEYESEEIGEEDGGEIQQDELEMTDDDQRHKKRTRSRDKGAKRDQETPGEDTEWVEPSYGREEFLSGPLTSAPNTGIKKGILRFYHSYGFDTHRAFNVHPLDKDHIVYISGNYLHFYNIRLKRVVLLLRSASGCGIGHIAVHPSKKYFAVGEKGDKPFIMIHTWPDLKVFRVLRKGTMRGYSYLDFSPNGELLCSQGMEPDFTLTIWDWAHEKRILRRKGSQNVHRANFSTMTPKDLTTSGVGHIQFWKMLETEAGPVLQERMGDFGIRDPFDIPGFAGVAEGKVVSGSPWGNLLVWDGGRITVEITQKEGKTCHGNEVTDVQHQDAEMLTIGKDGFIRIWETELLELAAIGAGQELKKVEVEPLLELNLGSQFRPLSAVRTVADENDSKTWFIQDSWGKVWLVDINAALATMEYSPGTLLFAPAGPINGIGLSRKFTVMVVGTEGGHLWALEYIQKTVLARKVYVTPVNKILWIPMKYDPTGQSFLVGFEDGTVKLMALNILVASASSLPGLINEVEAGLSHAFSLIQSLKFHKGQVSVLKIDEEVGILYTCGADRTIFGSRISWNEKAKNPILVPLSFVTSPFVVVSLDLHPFKNYRFIIAGRGGRVAECRRPNWDEIDSSVSYDKGKLHGRRWVYKSVKSSRRHDEDRQKRKEQKTKELDELYKNIQSRREAGVLVEEDLEVGRVIERYRRQQAKEDDMEIHIPPTPCPILSIYYHINPRISGPITSQTFFLHVGEYDAGYIYECKYNRPDPGGFHAVPPSPPFTNDVAIKCFLVSRDDKYLLFGMMDGNIRVMPRSYQQTSLVDRHTGIIPQSEGTGSGSSSDEADPMNDGATTRKKPHKVVVPPFPVSNFPYELQSFWTLPMHDPDRGPVVELAWSFDHQFLMSVGLDGAIFAYRWDPDGRLRTNEDMLPQPFVPRILHVGSMDDTEVLDGLTLEELKKKAEGDRIHELTEGTKEIIRRQLRKLRVDYRAIVQKNDEVPLLFRLPRSKLGLDPRIKDSRQVQFKSEIDKVYRQYEWDGSRSGIGCEKIKEHFLDTIETHHKNVKDLEHTVEVHTFRHRSLTPSFLEICRWNQEILANEKSVVIQEDGKPLESQTAEASKTPEQQVKRIYAKDLIGEYTGKKYEVKTEHAIRHLEERLERRYVRECELAQLNAQNVPENYEASEDLEAIHYAVEHMGDYKLKTGEEYLLNERVTTAERRKRILDLKIMIYESFQEFNRRVKVLQEEKVSVIETCRKLEHEIRERHKYLPPEMRVPVPAVHDIEFFESPESVFQISEQDIVDRQNQKLEAAGLLKRKKIASGEEIEEASHVDTLDEEKTKVKRKIYKPGDFIRNRNDPRAPKVVMKKLEQAIAISVAGPTMKILPKRKELEGLSSAVFRYRKAFFNPKTEAAQRRRDRILARRSFERDYILEQLQRLIDYFKQRVIQIRNERIELQLDVKVMTIGMLVLIQELDIVKEDETLEREVYDKYEKQKVDLEVAKRRVAKARRRLNLGKKDLKKVEDSLTKLAKEVSTLIYDQGRFSEFLWRVFRRRIQMTVAGGVEDDILEEEDEEEEEHEDNEEQEDGEGSEVALEYRTSRLQSHSLYARKTMYTFVCPDDLDQEVYDKVCEFRQKKDTLDAELGIHKLIVDKQTEDLNGAKVQFEDFQAKMFSLEEQIKTLQRERQQKINNLNKLVILKANQVQCLEEDKMDMDSTPIIERIKRNFPNIDNVIVFPKDGIHKLDQKIEELKDEIGKHKRKQQRARVMMIRLREELRKKESHVEALLEECRKDMIGRFGRVVDMEDVCAGSINLEVIDIMEKVEAQRKIHYAERDQLNKSILKTRHDLTSVTSVNSEYNTMLAMLEERQRDVDYFLYQQGKSEAAAQKEIAESGAGDSVASCFVDNEEVIDEMYSYQDRVIRQEAKIMYLRETIANCKVKGGIPEITLMTSIPDQVASKFMTFKELQEYKSYLNKEVETLFLKNNMDQLLQSTSVMPSFNVSRLGQKEVGHEAKGHEQEILEQLDEITNKYSGNELADTNNEVDDEMIDELGTETEEYDENEREMEESNRDDEIDMMNVDLPEMSEVYE